MSEMFWYCEVGRVSCRPLDFGEENSIRYSSLMMKDKAFSLSCVSVPGVYDCGFLSLANIACNELIDPGPRGG